MLTKANPAYKNFDELEATGLTTHEPLETTYPLLQLAHVVAAVQTEHYDGHAEHEPIVVAYPAEQMAHDDVPF